MVVSRKFPSAALHSVGTTAEYVNLTLHRWGAGSLSLDAVMGGTFLGKLEISTGSNCCSIGRYAVGT